MKVLVLVGSRRTDSFNGRFARAAVRELPGDVEVEYFDRLHELPHYEQELDDSATPEAAVALRRAVTDADALLLVTPEYNGRPSSLIKNAIDWASRPREDASLHGKPAAVLGASPVPWGAKWAREGLVRSLGIAGAKPFEDTVGIGSAHEALQGDTIADAETRAAVAALAGLLVGRPVQSDLVDGA